MTEMIKGKRTKRQRPVSPLSLAITSSSSNLGDQESVDEPERISNNMVSASSSSEFAESVREEEDMANCLILLANSHQTRKSLEPSVTTSNAKVSSLCAYECKTCNRRFPSFQALGGHRASHKKPNYKPNEEKKSVVSVMEQEEDQFNAMSTILSLHIPNRVVCNNSITNCIKTNKVHECSICGAEFSSGQALGGHMRRHRAIASTSTTPSTTTTTTMSLVTSSPESQESKKPRNSLELDLNLPAPEDDLQDNKFHFSSNEQVLVFTVSSLVDCHY